MKPRLETAILTPEDQRIWIHVAARFRCNPLSTLWLSIDRRDGNLMWGLEMTRWRTAGIRPQGYRCAIVHTIMRDQERRYGVPEFPPGSHNIRVAS